MWDGCSVHDADKLEKVQVCAARIVTGFPILVPVEALYLETGWEILQTRRYIAKMKTMFKSNMGSLPDY